MNNDMNMGANLKAQFLRSDANLDSITGEPVAHPVGTGVGAFVGGELAAAVTGTVVGPVGTVIGAAVGAVAGGFAGKGVAETIDPKLEETYWLQDFNARTYVEQGSSFGNYGPAYGFGVSSFERSPGRSFEDVEPEMSSNWTSGRGSSRLTWNRARPAARDEWTRLGSDPFESQEAS